MSFETGVSTSPSNLLSKLVTRLTTDGWTIVRTNGSPGTQVSISDGSATEANQLNFLADDTAASAHIACQPSVSDGGSGVAFYAHTGSPNTSGSGGTFVTMGQRGSSVDQGFSGTHTAYFFFTGSTSDGRYCHVIVEGTSGVYFHLYFGTLEKAGTFTGGQYVTAGNFTTTAFNWPFQFNEAKVNSTSWIRCDEFFTSISVTTDAGSSRWHEAPGFAHNNTGGSTSYAAGWYQGGLIAFNQRTPFGPNLLVIWNSLSPTPAATLNKILGHVPDARLCSMDQREGGDKLTIGSDDWHIFPVHVKDVITDNEAYNDSNPGAPAPHHRSNLAGFALLEVP